MAVVGALRGHKGVIIGEPGLARFAVQAPQPPGPLRGDAVRAEPETLQTVEELYVELAPELVRFATTLVGPSHSEDLLGSTVAKAIASARWDRVDNKRAYLYRMLVNEAHKSRRGSARRRNRELRVAHRDSVDMEGGLDLDVFAALKRLTVRQRAVIHLTYWADLPPQQVADTMGASLRTVERELANARTRLEAMLS